MSIEVPPEPVGTQLHPCRHPSDAFSQISSSQTAGIPWFCLTSLGLDGAELFAGRNSPIPTFSGREVTAIPAGKAGQSWNVGAGMSWAGRDHPNPTLFPCTGHPKNPTCKCLSQSTSCSRLIFHGFPAGKMLPSMRNNLQGHHLSAVRSKGCKNSLENAGKRDRGKSGDSQELKPRSGHRGGEGKSQKSCKTLGLGLEFVEKLNLGST